MYVNILWLIQICEHISFYHIFRHASSLCAQCSIYKFKMPHLYVRHDASARTFIDTHTCTPLLTHTHSLMPSVSRMVSRKSPKSSRIDSRLPPRPLLRDLAFSLTPPNKSSKIAPKESLISFVVSSLGRNSFQKASTSKGAPEYPVLPEDDEEEEEEPLHPANGLAELRRGHGVLNVCVRVCERQWL